MGFEYHVIEELMAGHADELYVFRTNIWQLVLESGLDEETVSGYVARLAKNEVNRRLADNKESVQQLLDVLKEKDTNEFSVIFDITEGKAQHLKSSLMEDRFFTLIDPEMLSQEKMKETGLPKTTFYNYLSALKELVPGIGSPKGVSLDK